MYYHTNNSKFEIFFLIFAFLIILVFARNYLFYFWYSITCKNWPKVSGIITTTPHLNDIWSSNSSQMVSKSGFSVHLRYEYEVDGEKYDGSNISFKSTVTNNHVLAEKMAEMYEKGEVVDVYYHPKKPYISVLNTK
jgi:hypothetical protein